MQIAPGFSIRTAIDKAAANGVNTPLTDNGRHFCLLYHLKGVFNTRCGGQHLHIPLSQSELKWLGKWRDHFCGGVKAPSVQEVDKGGRSQAYTLSDQTGSLLGS